MAKTPPSGTKSTASSDAMRPKVIAAADNKPARRRETLASLRGDMENIINRLHQADELTQQSVVSLQMAFSALERRVSQEGPVNKAALTRRVDQLSEHLTGLIKETQKYVGEELRAAQKDPSAEKLKAAIAASENRLATAEIAQADALSKVNRHIAQLAKAIDTRFTEEAAAQKASMDKLDQALRTDLEDIKTRADKKLETIETSSAKAIRSIGEKVVTLSDDIKEKTDTQNKLVSEKIASIAAKTQKDFVEYRNDTDEIRKQLERRVESLEENQRNLDSYTDRSLSSLTSRLDNLEYGLTHTAPPVPAEPAAPTAANPNYVPKMEAVVEDDPFSPDAYQSPAQPDTSVTGPNLSLVPQSAVMALPDAYSAAPAAAFMPTEYDPNGNAAPNTSSQTFMPVGTPPAAAGSAAIANVGEIPIHQDHLSPAPMLQSPAAEIETPPAPELYAPDTEPTINPAQISAEDLPYADPAYAEQSANVEIVRPGTFGARKNKKIGVPNLGGRKKQVAAAAVLLATVGYFALRGSPDAPAPTANNTESEQGMFFEESAGTAPVAPGSMTPREAQPFSADLDAGNNIEAAENPSAITSGSPEVTGAAIGETPVDVAVTQPAVGTYQDNQGLSPEGKSAAPATLEAAAKDGDPIAEFQLGLARLQDGETKEAMQLIRSAANKGQPAAQYRLAKFYEAGEGVTEDASVARQLTERAARSGNRIAMHDLALYYAEGRGDVQVNIKTAAGWFEKAAQRGVVDSQYNLGVLFESGQGLPKNLKEAYVWYGVAAAQGDQFARKQVRLLGEQLSEDDLKAANARVKNFKPASLDEEANGIFRNVAWSVPGQKLAVKKQVAETQNLLGKLGYDAGSADGSMGPKTRAAIKSFQKDRGLSETGQVNAALLSELQKAAGA